MKKLTQTDLWLLEVIGVDRWSIAEIYQFSGLRKVNLDKVDKSLDKLISSGMLTLDNKKYFKTTH